MARTRRGRGEGSVFLRSDGLWTGSLTLGYDGNGKRRRRVVYGATKTEADAILRASQGDRLEALYTLAMTTGVREGEFFGLHWPDVDLKGARLFVRQQLCELNGRLWLDAPKTDRSRREVRLSEVAVKALREHQKRMLAEGHLRADGLVFTSAEGAMLRKSNFLRRE